MLKIISLGTIISSSIMPTQSNHQIKINLNKDDQILKKIMTPHSSVSTKELSNDEKIYFDDMKRFLNMELFEDFSGSTDAATTMTSLLSKISLAQKRELLNYYKDNRYRQPTEVSQYLTQKILSFVLNAPDSLFVHNEELLAQTAAGISRLQTKKHMIDTLSWNSNLDELTKNKLQEISRKINDYTYNIKEISKYFIQTGSYPKLYDFQSLLANKLSNEQIYAALKIPSDVWREIDSSYYHFDHYNLNSIPPTLLNSIINSNSLDSAISAISGLSNAIPKDPSLINTIVLSIMAFILMSFAILSAVLFKRKIKLGTSRQMKVMIISLTTTFALVAISLAAFAATQGAML